MLMLNDLTVRDGQQSLLATRMRTDDIIKIVSILDNAGYYAMEVWGGATFDAPLRYLKEDPWERLRVIRGVVTKTKLMMLLRGKNLVGYRHYPEDVITAFIEKAYENGIDIFRVFDALNDPNNLAYPVKVIKSLSKAVRNSGALLQVAIVYSISPVHTIEYYEKVVEEFVSLFEPDFITIKDMAGILTPGMAVELVKMIKKQGVKVNVHSHATSGMAPMTLIKAAEAGADLLDVVLSPFSHFSSHPAAEPMVEALRSLGLDPGINEKVLYRASKVLEGVKAKYSKYDYSRRGKVVDINVLNHQIPGGMISNLLAQLRDLKAEDKLEEVLEEVQRVRKDLGWPPLVTPMSQIVGSQAVVNVLSGRYKVLLNETVNYLLGKYGRAPAPVNEELRKRAEEMVRNAPKEAAEAKTLEDARRELSKVYVEKEEDYITYALFPEQALKYFEERYKKKLAKAVGLGWF